VTERFTLLEKLGRGGMGVVWKARDEETGQIVALKLLHLAFADDPDYLARFERELELARRIHSPNVVEVLGYGVQQATPYLALEYVDGPSLRERLAAHGPFTWPDACELLVQIARGLADAHAAGVIHRDIKPSNILIGSDGVAKLADFGIAKGLDLTRVTGTSALLGTPAYLAPEGPRDERADLYSLGVVAYELMTGVPPFDGSTYAEILLAHLRVQPDLGRLPKDARPMVARLLAKDPKKRQRDAHELINSLQRYLEVHVSTHTPVPKPSNVEPVAKERVAEPNPAMPVAPTPLAVSDIAPSFRDPRPRPNRAREHITPGQVGLRGRGRRGPLVVGLAAGLALVVFASAALAGGFIPNGSGSSPTASRSVVAEISAASMSAGLVASSAVAGIPSPLVSPSPSVSPGSSAAHGQFALTGSMVVARTGQTATLLQDGRVLIAGGYDTANKPLASAELYDPLTGKFSLTGSMASGRTDDTATLLNDGSVLVAGGYDDGGKEVGSAEVYNPDSGTFAETGSMTGARAEHTATLLEDGRVLIAGGFDNWSAETYDPTTGRFTATGHMTTGRSGQTATLLADGRVLLTGGCCDFDRLPEGATPLPAPEANPSVGLQSAELFDPNTGSFTATGSMTTPREWHTATPLSDGRVLIAGGSADFFYGYNELTGLESTELYDPNTGKFTAAASMAEPLWGHTATLLPNSRVLVVGGFGNPGAKEFGEIYDSAAGTFTGTGFPLVARTWQTATALLDGNVLIAGGWNARAEVYTP
jgi:serine/threonine protein kinase